MRPLISIPPGIYSSPNALGTMQDGKFQVPHRRVNSPHTERRKKGPKAMEMTRDAVYGPETPSLGPLSNRPSTRTQDSAGQWRTPRTSRSHLDQNATAQRAAPRRTEFDVRNTACKGGGENNVQLRGVIGLRVLTLSGYASRSASFSKDPGESHFAVEGE